MDSIVATNNAEAPEVSYGETASAPTVRLYGKYKGKWSGDNLTIDAGDRVDLRWNSSDADSCSATGPGFSAAAASGYDWKITEPSSGNSSTYIVSCTGPGGTTKDSLTITARMSENDPSAILSVAVYKNGQYIKEWSYDDAVTIKTGDQVAIGWRGNNATSCSSPTDSLDVSGIKDIDWNVSEPAVGYTRTFTLICEGPNGTAMDSLVVTNPVSATLQASSYSVGSAWSSWSSDDITISGNQQIILQWSSDGATNCSALGNGFEAFGPSGQDYSVDEPSVGTMETYMISCTGPDGKTGEDSLVVTNSSVASGAPTVLFEKNIYSNNSWSGWSEGDATINSGDTVNLRWNSQGANRCSSRGSGFGGYNTRGTDYSINEPSRGNSRTFSIICDGDGGTVSEDIVITTR